MDGKSLCNVSEHGWKLCFSGSAAVLVFALMWFPNTKIQALQVTEGNLKVVVGGVVVLPCKVFGTTEELSQISWQRKTRGNPQDEDFFIITPDGGPKFVGKHDDRFKFVGSVNDLNGSLQLSSATLMDDGTYWCIIFSVFPRPHVKEMRLDVFVPPVSSLEDSHPLLGNEEVPLVSCMAAGSKPPADVKWNTGALAEKVTATTNYTSHKNGTTTTVSTLFGVPTREINNKSVQCVVTSAAREEEILPFTVQVYFRPLEVSIREHAGGFFECVTEANPNATFTWSRSDLSWPQSAFQDAEMLKMTSDLNGLYQCEASNAHGANRGYLYIHVAHGDCTACWILFSLLFIANVAAAVWYLKSGKCQRIREMIKESQAVRTTSSSPDVAEGVEESDEGQEETMRL